MGANWNASSIDIRIQEEKGQNTPNEEDNNGGNNNSGGDGENNSNTLTLSSTLPSFVEADQTYDFDISYSLVEDGVVFIQLMNND